MQSSQDQSSEGASADAAEDTFACPTRRDGSEGLIAQTVTAPLCQTRQRSSYHKCWSCARRNNNDMRPAPKLKLAGAEVSARANTG